MNCEKAAPFVSVLYDGEPLAAEAATHIAECNECRERLYAYSRIGAELRLTASTQHAHSKLPQNLREKMDRSARWRFWTTKLPSPRLALASCLGALIALSATLPLMRAQSESPRWFQFELSPADSHSSFTYVARTGFDDPMAWLMTGSDGKLNRPIEAHVAVTEISDGAVQISVHARTLPASNELHAPLDDAKALNLQGHVLRYTPGEKMQIPVDGGGFLTLRGEVVHDQPEIAGGLPLKPSAAQLVVRDPILISDEKVLMDMKGASSAADEDDREPQAIDFYVPGTGRFIMALQHFEGAVRGEANWGELSFKIDREQYRLLANSPLTGGAQPHPVWVRRDSHFEPSPQMKQGFIGSGSLDSMSQ